MRDALTSEAMRAAEAAAVATGGVTLDDLMARAGEALARHTAELAPVGPVTVVCGAGNNAGDGWVAARLLAGAGRTVKVVALREPEHLAAEASHAARAAIAAGVPWTLVADEAAVARMLAGSAVVVDAVFGIGIRGPAREPFASAIRAIASAGAPVVSADIPSGVDADTGVVAGDAVVADLTVTFTAEKPGLLLQPGATHAGRVVIADVGVGPEAVCAAGRIEVWEPADYRRVLPAPRPDEHKGSRGTVAVVAGSSAYPGAAVLAVEGALRMGAGYVVAIVPNAIADLVLLAHPNVLVRPVAAASDGSMADPDAVAAAVHDADAVVAGPGLTTGPGVGAAVAALLAAVATPLLLDADALNIVASAGIDLAATRAPLVLTPHPGEAGRLLGEPASAVAADRLAAAARLAAPGVTCLMKGPRTVVASDRRRGIVLAGNAGLARAGTGDVLAGMVGTLLAQGVASFEAAMLGAYLHGRAAEIGTEALTETSFTATDVPRFLPEAVRSLVGG